MAYQWTKDLETGNTLIDRQHRQLIDAINQLLEACSKGQGRDRIESIMKFLNDYVNKHFSDEEILQVKYKYPDYVNHRRYHEEFKKVVAGISADIRKEGPTISHVAKVNSSIAGWLLNHIKKEDRKVAEHIQKNT